MALVKVNWKPSQRQLRQFGGICVVALPLVTWFWSGHSPTAVLIAAIAGVLIGLLGLIVPRALQPLFVSLSVVTVPIGILMGEIAMLFIYGCMLLPIGLFFRLTGRDSLRLHRNVDAQTYWLPKKQAPNSISYYRQF